MNATTDLEAGDDVPPAVEATSLNEVRDIVRPTIKFGRRKVDLDGPAMTVAEISRRAAEFVELREAGMFRPRV